MVLGKEKARNYPTPKLVRVNAKDAQPKMMWEIGLQK
jgi:hypothetical protein